MWATRPHLGSIFEKLLHRKTFCLPAARIFGQFVFIKILFHMKHCIKIAPASMKQVQ